MIQTIQSKHEKYWFEHVK